MCMLRSLDPPSRDIVLYTFKLEELFIPLLLKLLPDIVYTGGSAVAQTVSCRSLLPGERLLPEGCGGGGRRRYAPRGQFLLLSHGGVEGAVEDGYRRVFGALGRTLLLPRLRLLVGAVAQGPGQLPDVEELVVDDHEEEAEEEGQEDSDEDLRAVPAVEQGLPVAEGPEGDQQDVLDQHDGVEGEDFELGVLFLQVQVAEDVDVGHTYTQQYFLYGS